MPVMGRFRLRRESRRAFLHSFGLQSEARFYSFAENLNLSAFARHYVCQKVGPPAFHQPLLNVLNSRISMGARKQALHLRPASRTSC